jgi:CheY-like chemotaxis protein
MGTPLVDPPVILIIEDEPSIRRLIRRVLANNGYGTLEAANGEQGLEFAKNYAGEIPLAILDIVMPRLGGLDVANQLHIDRPATKLLYISGFLDSVAMESITRESPDSVLAKPFTSKRLLQQVRKLLAAHA